MSFIDKQINKDLIAGRLPNEQLKNANDYTPTLYDFESLAQPGLKLFREYPLNMNGLFRTILKRVYEIESLKQPELYLGEINLLIITGYTVDEVNPMKLEKWLEICPVVTIIDKVAWYGAWTYFYANQIMSEDDRVLVNQDMMYTWIYLLKEIQKKEIKYGKTINTKSITDKTNILKLIEADWDKVDKKYFSKLTEFEKRKLIDISETVSAISDEIRADFEHQLKTSKETEQAWEKFLDIINDLSKSENAAICKINASGSPKDKLRIINEYNSVIRKIERRSYELNGEEIDLSSLYGVVNDRMQGAPTYCVACDSEGGIFRLHPAVVMLAMEPYTFNYILMTYHQFRINPGKDTAKKFVELALRTLRKNLGEDEKSSNSLEEMIADFYNTVSQFLKNNSSALETLKFEILQKDEATTGVDMDLSEIYAQRKDEAERIKEYRDSPNFEKDLEMTLSGRGKMLSVAEISELYLEEDKHLEKISQETIARRLIVSLNIIYLFCDALRIMLTNRHACITFKNKDYVEKYRNELLKIDDKLVHKVYSSLGEQEMNMLEYREKVGIIATSLSEQESVEEKYRNDMFSDVLKGSILSLVEDVEKQDPEQIMKTKALIREEIRRYPDCDEKERYTDWLDSISQRLGEILVANCQKEDDYQSIKMELLAKLGEKTSLLPVSTVDSLTTAEMLYARYATDDYAMKGFDFSCISALYYQAFEEAYNTLIWKGYSDELNSLYIGSEKYTDILERCRNSDIDVQAAVGYLDPKKRQRGFYIDYKSAERLATTVSPRCMYKSFAILLENIKPSSPVDKFCEYFAKISGYNSSNDMFSDAEYMRNCNSFILAVDSSTGNRNNASHGGTFISKEQCKADKKTVLNELETVRSDSLGLIQQLLFLLKK